MTQGAFVEFDQAARRQADTSVTVWQGRILPKLTRKEVIVFRALHGYLTQTGFADATGGELTEFMKARGLAKDVNGCRPRLTGLADKGWVLRRWGSRPCRNYTTEAHPYVPVVPLAALHDLNPKDGGR